MILLCGIPSETPLALVRAELEKSGAPYLVFNQREAGSMRLLCEVSSFDVDGWLQIGEDRYGLGGFDAVYNRLMDDTLLPEVRSLPVGAPAHQHSRSLHDALISWCEIGPARVVNRCASMASNRSKPYQAQLIRAHGLAIPDTLVTNDPDAVREFRRKHGKVVYKSISGIRSIVSLLDESDMRRIEQIRWCPVQFQEYVEGIDIRLHVVAETVFASAIRAQVTDYRYAGSTDGSEIEVTATDVSDELAGVCVSLAQGLGLVLAGIDLRISPQGTTYCFEVNPSPAFSFYENETGQPIARAIARYLAGETSFERVGGGDLLRESDT